MSRLIVRLIVVVGFCIALVLTLATPLLTTFPVTSLDQLGDVRFGFPFPFIAQQSPLSPFAENLPLVLHLSWPKDAVTRILPVQAVLSFATLSLSACGVLLLSIFAVIRIWTRIRRPRKTTTV